MTDNTVVELQHKDQYPPNIKEKEKEKIKGKKYFKKNGPKSLLENQLKE